jgi:hypothetical protein
LKAKLYVDCCSIYKTENWHLRPTLIYFNAFLGLTPKKSSDKLIVSHTFSKFLYGQLNVYAMFTKTSIWIQYLRIYKHSYTNSIPQGYSYMLFIPM